MWRLFCHHLFVISPSSGTPRGLRFVIVAFLGLSSFIFLLTFVIIVNKLLKAYKRTAYYVCI